MLTLTLLRQVCLKLAVTRASRVYFNKEEKPLKSHPIALIMICFEKYLKGFKTDRIILA